MDPELRATILRGLLGAGAGATALGLSHALNPRDPDERGGIGRKALLGAILGGTGAVAIPTGLKMLGGGIQLPNEKRTGPMEGVISSGAGALARNYGAAAGGIGAGALAHRANKGLVGGFLQGPSAAKVQDMIARSPLSNAAKQRLNTKLVPGISSRTLRDLANRANPDLNYINFTKKVRAPRFFDKIPMAPRRVRVPTRSGLKALTSLRSLRDPRARMLAAIAAGLGVGAIAQRGVEGSV